MSQEGDSLVRVKKVLVQHRAFAKYKKPEPTGRSSPYLKFMKVKRAELLSQDPAAPRKQVMNAVVSAWRSLSPEEKRSYKVAETPSEATPVARVDSEERAYEEPKKRPRTQPQTDAYEQAPYRYTKEYREYQDVNIFSAFGNALKAVADFFLVRPL